MNNLTATVPHTMMSIKDVAIMYNTSRWLITQKLIEFHIIEKKDGKGNRKRLLPLEVASLMARIGDPIRVK